MSELESIAEETLSRKGVADQNAPAAKPSPDSLFEAIRGRRSMGLSRLSPDPVDPEIIEHLMMAANWAPSNEDTEPWRFQVFSGEGREVLARAFATATSEEGARKRAFASPVWIAIVVSPKFNEEGQLVTSMDEELMATACAVQNLHLTACNYGLAGMWHSKGISVNPEVGSALGLEPHQRLLGFFMCGWPNCEMLTSSRGDWQEKVTWHR